jgi:4a-hydroxytetrahydrobiopterin dehydratase
MERLNEQECRGALETLPEWSLEGGEIVRRWSFADFRAAMRFVNAVAELAETAGHHPDIDIRYNHVRLALVTHDSGGITAKDVAMARRLDGVPVSG